MTTFKSLSLIIGSLFIFLYTLKYMRTLLEKKLSLRLKTKINSLTDNYHLSFFFGIIFTFVLSSSSALTAIIITFLSAKIISKRSALALILGSNIGTTITSIFFTFNLLNYSFFLLLLSFIFFAFKFHFLPRFLASLGVLFFSLLVLQETIILKQTEISGLISPNPLISFFEGILFSMLINSSSSTIITSNILYNLNTINLYQGLAIMLGANIGTTINTLFFSIGINKDAFSVIIINIIINILSGFLFLIFLDYFEKIIFLFTPLIPENAIISFSHLIYNIISTLFFYIVFALKKEK